ncbi:hypothetical protein ACU686_44790 [Yinghuangia aomiensis]
MPQRHQEEPGLILKPAATRQRRNRADRPLWPARRHGRARTPDHQGPTLVSSPAIGVDGASPMAFEFVDGRADIHGPSWPSWSTSTGAPRRPRWLRRSCQQRQCFGLTPIDRLRLQWEIEAARTANGPGPPHHRTGALLRWGEL